MKRIRQWIKSFIIRTIIEDFQNNGLTRETFERKTHVQTEWLINGERVSLPIRSAGVSLQRQPRRALIEQFRAEG